MSRATISVASVATPTVGAAGRLGLGFSYLAFRRAVAEAERRVSGRSSVIRTPFLWGMPMAKPSGSDTAFVLDVIRRELESERFSERRGIRKFCDREARDRAAEMRSEPMRWRAQREAAPSNSDH